MNTQETSTSYAPDFVKTFIQLVAALCAKPKDLRVEVIDGHVLIVNINPHASDFGSLCGKRGSTIRALKVVGGMMADRKSIQATFALNEGGGGWDNRRQTIVKPDSKEWTSEDLDMLASLVCKELFDGPVQVEWRRFGPSDVKMTLIADVPPSSILEDAINKYVTVRVDLDGMEDESDLAEKNEAVSNPKRWFEKQIGRVFHVAGKQQGVRIAFELRDINERRSPLQ